MGAAKFDLGWLIWTDVAPSCFTLSRWLFPPNVSLIKPEVSFSPLFKAILYSMSWVRKLVNITPWKVMAARAKNRACSYHPFGATEVSKTISSDVPSNCQPNKGDLSCAISMSLCVALLTLSLSLSLSPYTHTHTHTHTHTRTHARTHARTRAYTHTHTHTHTPTRTQREFPFFSIAQVFFLS